MADFRRDNHYVPRSYLKRWSRDGSKLWLYRLLVSHSDVPQWRETSLRGIAFHEHLYTRIVASGESDELERWLDTEFEAPAEPVIERVLSNRRLTPADWKVLIRFFAAQDVRTPARLVENLKRWSETLPDLIQETITESVAQLEQMSRAERALLRPAPPSPDDAPFRVSVEKDAEKGGGWVKGETISGRGLWLWSIRHALKNTVRALLEYKWTILTPPDGVDWFTTDDPAIKLNFNSPTDYTFGGGWGSVGTDLFLPLGPRHLLFTQIGKSVPARGTQLDPEKALLLRRIMAEHAHRYVFAVAPDSFVEGTRPRTVDPEAVRLEANEWQDWHSNQSQAERDLYRKESPDRKSPNDH